MDNLSGMVLVDLLDAFSSNEPVPGGGSAAALAGAVGASLLMMVAGLPTTRGGTPEETADLAEASARLRPLRDALTSLIDRDSDAYAAVIAAMRLPKTADPKTRARRDAIDAALRKAIDVPMDTVRACRQVLREAVVVAANGNTNAATDTGTAILLLLAAVHGATLNVNVNLRSVRDAALAQRVGAERDQLTADAESDAARATGLLS